jgi:glycosyltransferase involved in cell wall biosynthesis
MDIAMIFPTRESEKAISGYASTLTESMQKQGINVENITYYAGKPLSVFKIISKIKKYELIHIQHEYNLLGGYGLPFFLLYFLLRYYKKKVITTMHTVLSQNEKFKGNKLKTILRKILYRTQNKLINRVSNKIVVHANFFKEILIREYQVKPEKIIVLPQGIIEGIKTLSKKEARKKFNLSGPVYLFMGSMVSDHGHDIIIKQADKIGSTILIVANPVSVNDRNTKRNISYLEENQNYVKKNKLSKFVRFDVFDINDKKPEWWEYFSAADLIMLPYRGGIGSGIFAHAMAMKKPVIASEIKFFKEISANFNCVKTVSQEKNYPLEIKKAMSKRNYASMIKGCEKYVQEYGLSALSLKYKEMYNSIK